MASTDASDRRDLGGRRGRTIVGRLLSAAGRAGPAGVSIWFAYDSVAGEARTVHAVSDRDGMFVFDVPHDRLRSAAIGASIGGVEPVDLEPAGAALEPGDVVLIVDDIVPSHLRFGGA